MSFGARDIFETSVPDSGVVLLGVKDIRDCPVTILKDCAAGGVVFVKKKVKVVAFVGLIAVIAAITANTPVVVPVYVTSPVLLTVKSAVALDEMVGFKARPTLAVVAATAPVTDV